MLEWSASGKALVSPGSRPGARAPAGRLGGRDDPRLLRRHERRQDPRPRRPRDRQRQPDVRPRREPGTPSGSAPSARRRLVGLRPEPGRRRQAHRGRSALHVGDGSESPATARPSPHATGIAKFGDVELARRRHGRRSSTSTTAQAVLHKRLRRDLVAAKRRLRRAARPCDQPDAAGRHRQVQHGRGAGRREAGRACRLRQVHPLLPARLRRRGAVRRRLRHLQHALDHGRAAHARAGDPAHARRLPEAGAPLGRRSRAASGLHRLVVGLAAGVGLASRARRADAGVQPRPAAHGDGLLAANSDRLAHGRHADHADREHRARDQGHADPADPRPSARADW